MTDFKIAGIVSAFGLGLGYLLGGRSSQVMEAVQGDYAITYLESHDDAKNQHKYYLLLTSGNDNYTAYGRLPGYGRDATMKLDKQPSASKMNELVMKKMKTYQLVGHKYEQIPSEIRTKLESEIGMKSSSPPVKPAGMNARQRIFMKRRQMMGAEGNDTDGYGGENSEKLNLTVKELLALILVNRDWKDNDWETDEEGQLNASFYHDDVDMKKMRGVLSSLVQKGIISVQEQYVNRNKYTMVFVNNKYTTGVDDYEESINWDMFGCKQEPVLNMGYENFIEWAESIPESIVKGMMDAKFSAESFEEGIDGELMAAETFEASKEPKVKIEKDSKYESNYNLSYRGFNGTLTKIWWDGGKSYRLMAEIKLNPNITEEIEIENINAINNLYWDEGEQRERAYENNDKIFGRRQAIKSLSEGKKRFKKFIDKLMVGNRLRCGVTETWLNPKNISQDDLTHKLMPYDSLLVGMRGGVPIRAYEPNIERLIGREISKENAATFKPRTPLKNRRQIIFEKRKGMGAEYQPDQELGDYSVSEIAKSSAIEGYQPNKYSFGPISLGAESVSSLKLKKDSCCCGATKKTPCVCMILGSDCSAKEPMCACFRLKAIQEKDKKGAETFEADMDVGKEMLRQLGGRRFMMMVGAKQPIWDGDKNELHMKIGRNSIGANYFVIRLNPRDLYDLRFESRRMNRKTYEMSIKVKAEYDDVYADQLQDIFEQATGLYVRMAESNDSDSMPVIDLKNKTDAFKWIKEEGQHIKTDADREMEGVDYAAMTYHPEELEAGAINSLKAGDFEAAELFVKALNRQNFINQFQAEENR